MNLLCFLLLILTNALSFISSHSLGTKDVQVYYNGRMVTTKKITSFTFNFGTQKKTCRFVDNELFQNAVLDDCFPPSYENGNQGWKIHVSTDDKSFESTALAVVPILYQRRSRFKLLYSYEQAYRPESKSFQQEQFGKFVTIYPKNVDDLRDTVRALESALKPLSSKSPKPPVIKGDIKVGETGRIFIRYGVLRDRNPDFVTSDETDLLVRIEKDYKPLKSDNFVTVANPELCEGQNNRYFYVTSEINGRTICYELKDAVKKKTSGFFITDTRVQPIARGLFGDGDALQNAIENPLPQFEMEWNGIKGYNEILAATQGFRSKKLKQ